MMIAHHFRSTPVRCLALATILGVSALPSSRAVAQTITEIINVNGDGTHAFISARGIAVDGAGNVYAGGQGTFNVFKITPAGVIIEIIDSTGDGAGNGLGGPPDIAVDGAGNVYVTGGSSDNAFKITPAGVITEIIDSTGDGAGNAIDFPWGIAVDGAGNVYVTGLGTNNAFKITPAGVITEIIDATGDGAGNGLLSPHGIAVDAAGNAYVPGEGTDNVFKITPAGSITQIIDCTGDGTGDCIFGGAGNNFDRPFAVAVDTAGNAYAAGFFTNNAFKITPAGIITEIIDATGDGTCGSSFGAPLAIDVDGVGNVYVVGGKTFKVTPTGVITELIDGGTGLGVSGFGIAADVVGNAYVAAGDINKAFKITLAPDVDGDGVFDAVDACPNNTPGLSVTVDGRPLRDCNGDCLYDAADIQCLVDEMLNQ